MGDNRDINNLGIRIIDAMDCVYDITPITVIANTVFPIYIDPETVTQIRNHYHKHHIIY